MPESKPCCKNRYNIFDTPSGSYNFSEMKKKALIFLNLKIFCQFTKSFQEFKRLPDAVE
jgi:hypothetical protein